MAIYKKGADPVALRASAERMTAYARECEGVKTETSRAVHGLRGHWSGGDLGSLMDRWPPIESQLTSFGNDLGKLAEALRRNAGQQDSASGQGSGPGQPGQPGQPGKPGESGPGFSDVLSKAGWYHNLAGLPSLAGGVAGVLATYNKVDGALMSGKYLTTVTDMVKNDKALLNVLPNASKFGAYANRFADLYDGKGLATVFADGSKASKFIGKAGVLGPIGIGIGAAQTIDSIRQGNWGDAALNGVGTALSVGAVFAPPPINIACGVAGLGLAVYQNVPVVKDFVDGVGKGIGDVASSIGDGIGKAWKGIFG